MKHLVFKEVFQRYPHMKAALRVREWLTWPWLETIFDARGGPCPPGGMLGGIRATTMKEGIALSVELTLGNGVHRAEWKSKGLHEGTTGWRKEVTWSECSVTFALMMLEAEAAAAEEAGRPWLYRVCARCGWTVATTGAHHCAECATGPGRGPWKGHDLTAIILKVMPSPAPTVVQLDLFDLMGAA